MVVGTTSYILTTLHPPPTTVDKSAPFLEWSTLNPKPQQSEPAFASVVVGTTYYILITLLCTFLMLGILVAVRPKTHI